ncbi:NADP-dependent oxidoreductase domain-containing protein [Flagelloscypha sp. PMI_526]|nr:NADP-dependent oxidoreductase domain-containing protein [Flagelloscypha sp. PMI_526]
MASRASHISSKVEYRQLGKSGLRVSVPIIGAMSFGNSSWMPWVLDEVHALPIIKAAWDRGINTIDTANIYSNGASERIVGTFVKKYSIPRKNIIIATKVNGFVQTSENVAHRGGHSPNLRDQVNNSGLSRAAIFNATEGCLERLGTDYIDLLQIHRFDQSTPVEETMKALHDLIQSGKVRYIGASSMRCWQFAMMQETAEKNGWTKFVSMQPEYSLVYREEEREMIPFCRQNGVGIIPWSPLAGGMLSRPIGKSSPRADTSKGTVFERGISQFDEVIIVRIEEVAKKHFCSMSQVALAWLNLKVTSPIVGMNSVDRMEQSIVSHVHLDAEDLELLEEPYQPRPIRGHA